MDVGRYPLSITLLQKTDALKTEQQKETNSAYSSYRCYLQDWYYGKVKTVKGKEPLEEQMGIFPKSFVTMTKESDLIPDRMKYAIVNVCSGYKNSWFEAKEYDTR